MVTFPRWAALAITLIVTFPLRSADPSVESITPICGRRGETFTLALYGSQLGKPSDLLLYRPGVRLVRWESGDANTGKAVLQADSTAPLGAHPFRLRTNGGISELRQFVLVPDPIVVCAEGNSALAKAQVIPINACVAGSLAEGDVRWFAVELKRDQRCVAEVEGMRTGTSFLDTHLEVLDPTGKPLARSDDSPSTRQDALLSFVAPTTGLYRIGLRETNLGGSDDARFVLHLSDGLRPERLYPCGAQPGKIAKFRASDSLGEVEVSVDLPASARGTWPVHITHQGKIAPTPNLIRVTDHAIQLEESQTTAVSLPTAFHGHIAKAGEVDRFSFGATQGKPLLLQVWAWRLGSPLDPYLDLYDSRGNLLASSDDGEDHDSQLLFNPPTDGTYEVRIRDQRGQGGPGFFYRIEANEAPEVLECFLPRPNRLSQAKQTISVPKGSRVFANFGVKRGAREGEAKLTFPELPQGVVAMSQPVRPGQFLAPTLLEAGTQAPLGGGLYPVMVTDSASPGLKGSFRQVVDLVGGAADSIYQEAVVDRLAIAVVESIPFGIELEKPRAPLFRDGELTLKGQIVRKPGFDGPIEVRIPFLPPWVEAPEKVLVDKGKTDFEYPLLALPQVERAEWALALEATGNTPTGPARCASSFIPVKIVEPLATAAPVEPIAEQGSRAAFVFTMRGGEPLPEGVTARLLELPPRVGNTPVALTPGARVVRFDVPIEANGPVGSHPHIVCQLQLVYQGDKVVQYIGRDSTLRIEGKGTTSIGPDGKPLSRLEQLRRQAKPPVRNGQP